MHLKLAKTTKNCKPNKCMVFTIYTYHFFRKPNKVMVFTIYTYHFVFLCEFGIVFVYKMYDLLNTLISTLHRVFENASKVVSCDSCWLVFLHWFVKRDKVWLNIATITWGNIFCKRYKLHKVRLQKSMMEQSLIYYRF